MPATVPRCNECPARPPLKEKASDEYLLFECPNCGFISSFKLG